MNRDLNTRRANLMGEPSIEYDFFAPPRIVFGWGRRTEIGSIAASLGRRAFLVLGSRTLETNGVCR